MIRLSYPLAAALPKRFYKNASVLSCDGKFEITLDNRKLKTPSGAPFYVTSEPLALASKLFHDILSNCIYFHIVIFSCHGMGITTRSH